MSGTPAEALFASHLGFFPYKSSFKAVSHEQLLDQLWEDLTPPSQSSTGLLGIYMYIIWRNDIEWLVLACLVHFA